MNGRAWARTRAWRVVLFALLWPAMAAAGDIDLTIRFGVVPQQAASRTAQQWGPLIHYLAQQTGREFRFETAPGIEEFERRLARGEYDIAYMNPSQYTLFRRAPGYLAFAREKDRRLRGVLVVRKDSPYRALADLDGKTLAFPAPTSFAATVLPRSHLERRGVAFKAQFVNSHESVYRAVARGLFAAGGGIERTFALLDPDMRAQLRVLWTSPAHSPHAIAAHPRVDAGLVARIQRAMTALAGSARGRELLAALGFAGVEAAGDSDWDDIRALGLRTGEGAERR